MNDNKFMFLVKNKKHLVNIKQVYSNAFNDVFSIKITHSMMYTEKELYNCKGNFKDIKYIFSTWDMPIINEKIVTEFFPSLDSIFYAAGNTKYFRESFDKMNIKIYSAINANSTSVCEFTIAQILLANKNYFKIQYKYRKWSFLPKIKKFQVLRNMVDIDSGNFKAKIGLLGIGVIGKKVLQSLQKFDFELYVYDPYIEVEKLSGLSYNLVSIDYIFENCNVISNHTKDCPETENLIGKSLLLKMKKNSTLINTGRGAQINESDLYNVLRKRKDITALLDVTKNEPLRPWSLLYLLDNVFITPHIAGSLGNEKSRLGYEVINQLFQRDD